MAHELRTHPLIVWIGLVRFNRLLGFLGAVVYVIIITGSRITSLVEIVVACLLFRFLRFALLDCILFYCALAHIVSDISKMDYVVFLNSEQQSIAT